MGIFETINRRGMDGSRRLSEHDDIDSDFMQHSEHSMISAAEDVDGHYYHSHSRRKNDSNKSHIMSRENDYSDSDSDSYSDSYSDSDSDSDSISYYSSSDEQDDSRYDDDHAADKDDTTYTSPTSVSENNRIRDSNREDASESQNRKEKKGSFLGRLFGGKHRKGKKHDSSSKSSTKKSSGWGASDLSDGDIEHPESRDSSVDPDRLAQSPHVLQADTSFDIAIVDDGSRSQSTGVDDGSQSQSNYNSGDEGSSSQRSEKLSKKQLQEARRKSYERKLPGVVEERSMEDERSSEDGDDDEYGSYHEAPEGDYKNYKYSLPEEPEAAISSSRKGTATSRHSIPKETPDPPKEISKNTKASKKQQKKVQSQAQAHASTLTARNHAASSRVDYAGQISSPARNLTNKLNNEIHRLKTLVDLMMSRMELYERQSECLVEASVEHNREWKVANLETLKAKKRTKESPTDGQLSNIKSLLIERSVQDQWIRKLEGIQRGYQGRLATTQDQLKTLRYEHIRTTKQIIDLKKIRSEREHPRRRSLTKSGHTRRTSMTESDYTENTPTENMTDEASPNEGPTTPIVNNVPMQRWKGDTDGAGNPSGEEIENKSVSTLGAEGHKMTSLLEEMIVSWRTDGTDVSPLSEKLVSSKKKKKKKDKKKKKKKNKNKKDATPSVVSSTTGGKL